MKRPAERTSAAAATVTLIALATGWTPSEEETIAVVVLLGLLPRVVSETIDRGGVRGVLRLMWAGKGT